jgi:hypothetical protein
MRVAGQGNILIYGTIVPDSDRSQKKVWFQDTPQNQYRAITVYGIPTLSVIISYSVLSISKPYTKHSKSCGPLQLREPTTKIILPKILW